MSKKYVPPFLRDSSESAPSGRFASLQPTYTSKGAVENLVNTSQAAREAIPLAPTTVFSGSRVGRTTVLPPTPSEQDFPAINAAAKPTVTTGPWGGKKSFAELSREWAVKQQEDAENEKKEASMRALLEAEQRAQREKEEKERKALRTLHHHSSLHRSSDSDDEKYDIGGGRDHAYSMEDDDESDITMEEEVEEEELDDSWERSRNKHDYY